MQLPEPVARKNKAWLFLILLGDASYSIYLVHYPALGALKALSLKSQFLLKMGPTGLMTFFIVTTVASSLAFYWFVERPWLNWSRARLVPGRPGGR